MDDLLIDLPYSELAVLAGVIESNGSQLDDLNLQGADFLNPRYGEIYDVIVAMQASRTPIDPGSIGLQLPSERVFLWTVRDQVPHTASTEYHAELVREAAVPGESRRGAHPRVVRQPRHARPSG
jgi:replicative DNA helicase